MRGSHISNWFSRSLIYIKHCCFMHPLLTHGWLMLGKAPSSSFWHSELTTVTPVHTFNLNPPQMLWPPHKQSPCCHCHTSVITFSWPVTLSSLLQGPDQPDFPRKSFPKPLLGWLLPHTPSVHCVIPLLSIIQQTHLEGLLEAGNDMLEMGSVTQRTKEDRSVNV